MAINPTPTTMWITQLSLPGNGFQYNIVNLAENTAELVSSTNDDCGLAEPTITTIDGSDAPDHVRHLWHIRHLPQWLDAHTLFRLQPPAREFPLWPGRQ